MSHRNSTIVARRIFTFFFVASAMGLALNQASICENLVHRRGNAQEPRRNAAAQKLKNPEAKTDESVEAGKKLYQRHCASCHGPNAKGDGGLALAGGTPSDLTDETWDFGSTDGEIFVSIRDGVSSDMLAYKEKLNEKQIWQLVNFIRSIGPKSEKKDR